MGEVRRGISPVIATVIIVAAAIAMSIAVASWLMGLWAGFGQTESLRIYPDSRVNVQGPTLVLHVGNMGSAAAYIYRIEVSGVAVPADYPIAVEPGGELTLNLPLVAEGGDGEPQPLISAEPGAAYTVNVYTEAGNVYTAVVYGR